MDISYLMIYEKKIEKEKIIKRARESIRARVDGGSYSHQNGGSHKFQGGQKKGGQGSTNSSPPQATKEKGVAPNIQSPSCT